MSVQKSKFENVFFIHKGGKRFLATRSMDKGFTVHGEEIVKESGVEYRLWEPFQSKLAAAIAKGLKELPIKKNANVLYLGAANGATASFVSDMVEDGTVYCVEFSARAVQDLIFVCEKKENMLPLLADARMPEKYRADVDKEIDVIFEDVADKQQALILIENAKTFLKRGKFAMIAIKAKSISTVLNPKQIYSQIVSELMPHFEVLEKIDLHPFEKDHLFLLLRKK